MYFVSTIRDDDFHFVEIKKNRNTSGRTYKVSEDAHYKESKKKAEPAETKTI